MALLSNLLGSSFQGNIGPTGNIGITPNVSISVGTVTTGSPGSSASITNSGTTSGNAVFNFTIPRGDTGASGITTGKAIAMAIVFG